MKGEGTLSLREDVEDLSQTEMPVAGVDSARTLCLSY
jgi:hypothetical protein